MSVTTTIAESEQAGNDAKVAFDFAFKILSSADIIVDKKSAAGVYSDPLILGSDYTVSFDSDAQTGTVTFTTAPVTGGTGRIRRSTDLQQSAIIPREGTLPAATIENMVDKLTLQVQDLNVALDDAVLGTLSNPIQVGTFAVLDAAANATRFIGDATDTRQILLFLGDRSRGVNGWIVLGGY